MATRNSASIVKREECFGHDVYSGRAEQLVADGLVSQAQLPGCVPGMPKTASYIAPDGKVISRVEFKRARYEYVENSKVIRYISTRRCLVYVHISDAERERRYARHQIASDRRRKPVDRSLVEPADVDRLFAVPIIEYEAVRWLRETGQSMLALSVQDRRRLINKTCAEQRPVDEREAHAVDLMLKALTEIEAFQAIERVRRDSRHG